MGPSLGAANQASVQRESASELDRMQSRLNDLQCMVNRLDALRTRIGAVLPPADPVPVPPEEKAPDNFICALRNLNSRFASLNREADRLLSAIEGVF